MWRLTIAALATLAVVAARAPPPETEYHSYVGDSRVPTNVNDAELDAPFWTNQAQAALRARHNSIEQGGIAKNVILYLGDGMSVPTLAAARALLGQRNQRPGEEAQLSFEKFPIVGLSKTYCVNDQVADSACSATAYLCGVKANRGTLGVTARVARGNCTASLAAGTRVASVAAWALAAGKDVGIVTTTRITHASPAGTFAHSADRGWENDAALGSGVDPNQCPDIADQLVHHFPGKDFKVILGGGRRNFRPTMAGGLRQDGRNLIEEWREDKRRRGLSAVYADNARELRAANLDNTEYLMGLFSESHAAYNLERDHDMDPSLTELTEAALKILRRSKNGFFLFVEGGRIDHAHHDNRVELALDETVEFASAVEAGSNLEDTLVVVTADHAHVMSYNGYSPRGHDILGPARQTDRDRVPYMTLSYTNGPGFRPHNAQGRRDDPTAESTYGSLRWRTHVDVPLGSETHGGDDVAVFAKGPQQHVFTGLYEQSQIPHLIGFAACLGDGLHSQPCMARTSKPTN